MINIMFNGDLHKIKPFMTLDEFIAEKGIDLKYSAVAINRVFISRVDYKNTQLQAEDCIECVAPMQGG